MFNIQWSKSLYSIDKIVAFIGALQRNRYLKSVQQGLELAIPLLAIFSITTLILNFPYVPYQIWLRSSFNITDNTIYQVVHLLWLFTTISYVMGISYILAESFNKTSLVGMARYRSFLSMIISVTAYLTLAVTDYTQGLKRFPADDLLAICIALLASRIFIALSSMRPTRRNLYGDTSNPVLSRVYATLMPALVTLSIFVVLRIVKMYMSFHFVDSAFDIIYAHLHRKSIPISLSQAIQYAFMENIYWLFGIDSSMILSDVNGNRLMELGLPGYDFFKVGVSTFIFSRTFFAHFVYLGGEGALLGLVMAYWLIRVRTDYDKTIQLATVPVFFNINKLLIYGLPILANPIFIIPFLISPVIFTFISYFAFYSNIVPPVYRTVSWYTPIFISGYQSTGSIMGALLQLVNLSIGIMIYAPFLVLSRKIRDHEYNQGRKELIEFSINRYIVEENYLNVRTDVVGSAARILSADLRVALRVGQLYLVYQPKINFIERKIAGVEALIRWEHPVYGFIPPPVIVSMAQESDLINELSRWVIIESLSQVARWEKQGLKHVHVSVNLSAYEVNSPYLADFILDTLKFYNVDPRQLEVEIVETIELSVNDVVQKQLFKLVEQGVRLAIDDFGVGHGSAIYLKKFDISTLKVDKAISEDAHKDTRVAAIFNGVMRICIDLNVNMVIEHVETEEQLEYLVKRGGNIFQGYFFSKPLIADALFKYMKKIEHDKSILTQSLSSKDLHSLLSKHSELVSFSGK